MSEMPKNLEDCIKFRGNGDCKSCGYQPRKIGSIKTCNKHINLRSY